MSPFAAQYAEVLSKTASLPTVICDTDHVIAAAGVSKKEYLERRVTPALEDLMEGRRSFVAAKAGDHLQPVEWESRKRRGGVLPIIASGDVTGAVVMMRRSRRGAYRSGNQTDSNRGRLLRPSVGGIIDWLSPEKTACGGHGRSKEPPTADAS